MRLIDVKTLEFKDCIGTPDPYAILSHTWGEDEVSFRDFGDEQKRTTQRGFQKIKFASQQALDDGISYVWVDTCCINKESSAELSEAINSMFKWYERAKVCYAYLEDVSDLAASLSSSRWFTRGWTLQELIAPRSIQFFGTGWKILGSKESLLRLLVEITNIDITILAGTSKLSQVSVAERMRWASHRQTTREEDTAYCLMGIFDVNMAMLYGEGPKAFIRLQEEIMKETDDQTLFAWKASPESAARHPYRGLLASCPAEFAGAGGITSFTNITATQQPLSITSRGIPLTAVFEVQANMAPTRTIRVGLNCTWPKDSEYTAAIELVSRGGDQYVRSRPDSLFYTSANGSMGTFYVSKAAQTARIGMLPSLERQHSFLLPQETIRILDVYPADVVYSERNRRIPLGQWPGGMAVVKLEVTSLRSDFVFVALQATPDSSGHGCSPAISIVTRAQSVTSSAEQIWRLHSIPGATTMATRTARTKVGVYHMEGLVGLKKIQGFDVFCIEFHYS